MLKIDRSATVTPEISIFTYTPAGDTFVSIITN